MIRVAVLGAGLWGPHFVRHFEENHESKVVCVADPDVVRLKEIGIRYPNVDLSRNAIEAVTRSDVDAVVVATPASTHYELGRAALAASKHVLIEKPIAASLYEAQQLHELAKRSGNVLMVGHLFVHSAAVRFVKQQLDKGTLGSIYYLAMVRANLGPVRTDVNAAWDRALHDISIANFWLSSQPKSVSAIGGNWISPGLQDTVFATLQYPNNVLVNLHVSWLSRRKCREITVVTDSKTLVLDDLNVTEPVRVYAKGGATTSEISCTDNYVGFRPSIRERSITIPKVPLCDPLFSECLHFLDCIRSGKEPLTGARDGINVVRALEALDRSLVLGGVKVSISE